MAVTTTPNSTSAPAKFSWADIVKGSEAPTKYTLKPAARGERRCFCQGEILVMLGHYGWIMPLEEVDHPDVGKTAGRVYVHKRDVAKGVSLVKGDVVSFYLYADDQGLGAEECDIQQQRVSPELDPNVDAFVPAEHGFYEKQEGQKLSAEQLSYLATYQSADIHKAPTMRADADDFVPSGAGAAPGWNLSAAEFVPTPSTVTSSFNVHVAEFVPSSFSMINLQGGALTTDCSSVAAPKVSDFAINPAFLSDDESDDESSIVSDGAFSGIEGDKESNDSDDESTCNESVRSFQSEADVQWSSQLDAVVLCAPLKSSASSVDDSTSVGASGSDSEDAMPSVVRPPPGLSLPAGFRPPPGLSFPVFAA